jgi:hypothetical protein
VSYDYASFQKWLNSLESQREVLKVLHWANELFERAGAATWDKLTRPLLGDTWQQMAVVDRLVELGELQLIDQSEVAAQNRIYVRGRR